MDVNDGNKFKELITILDEEFKMGFTESKTLLWWNMFKPYPVEDFQRAVYAHLGCPDYGMFAPKLANIMKFIKGTEKQGQQQLEDRAQLAWATVESQISRIGSHGTLKMEDRQALGAVKSMGGWKQLCSCTNEELVWKRKEFIDAYSCFERTPLDCLPKNLAGRIEIENHKKESGEGMKNLVDGLKNFKNRIEDASSPKDVCEDERALMARDLFENQTREYIKSWLESQGDDEYRNDMRKRINDIKNDGRDQQFFTKK